MVVGWGEQGTGNREQGTGNREQGTGNREQGTGNREQGTGNREQGTGMLVWRIGWSGWGQQILCEDDRKKSKDAWGET